MNNTQNEMLPFCIVNPYIRTKRNNHVKENKLCFAKIAEIR